MVVVEPFKCSVKSVEGVFSENILASKIAEVEECVEGLDYIGGNVTFKRIHEDLHQCLRIISGPLFEIATLFKPLEPRE